MTEVRAGTLTEFLLARIAEDEADIDVRNMTCDCAVEGFPMLHGVTCPAKLRADYEAKRRTVAYYGDGGDFGDGGMLLMLLAIPYADHEHFRPEWRL